MNRICAALDLPDPVSAAQLASKLAGHVGLFKIGLELFVAHGPAAVDAGADGIVCAPTDVAALRKALGSQPLIVVPGIRPAGAAAGDQRRTGTPREAIRAGASLLVVGRPLRDASDPAAAADAIAREIDAT